MSLQAMLWALEQNVPPIPKLTLIGLANYAGADHSCWPSVASLCEVASASDRSVRDAIAELEESGRITVTRRPPRSSLYTLNVDLILTAAPRKPNHAKGAGYKPATSGIDWGNGPSDVTEAPQPSTEEAELTPRYSAAVTIDHANHAGSIVGITTLQSAQGQVADPAPDTGSPCKPRGGDPAHRAVNPSTEPTIEPKEGTLLRNGDATAPPAVTAPADLRKQLYSEGKQILREIMGHLTSDGGGEITRLLKLAGGNCAIVLTTLRAAQREQPSADGVMAFVTGGIKARMNPEPKFRQAAPELAYRLGLLEPEKRQEFQSGLTKDYSAFEREVAGHGN